jgi:putative intracellular protease/amidase
VTDPLRVLVADDHPALRLGMKAVIKSMKGEATLVGLASNGEHAVEKYRALRADVLTLDLRMPRTDGLVTLEQIVELDPSAKVLVMTTYDSEEDIFRSLEAGATGYILSRRRARRSSRPSGAWVVASATFRSTLRSSSEPYEALTHAGLKVDVASPRGGPAPVDPRGYPSKADIAGSRDALAALNATIHLSKVRAADYDAVFFPGGHGPMFDLATEPLVKKLIADFWAAGKPVAAVCHGPASLLNVVLPGGTTLLEGKRVTGFTRGEDAVDALFQKLPFSSRTAWSGRAQRSSRSHPVPLMSRSMGSW